MSSREDSYRQPYTDLALCDAEGAAIPLSSVAGKTNWVLLDFWATWCAPCCREIPHLREAYAAYKAKGFEIYCVSLDNDEAKWRSFTSDNDMPWINALGIDADKQSTAAASLRDHVDPRELPDLARRHHRSEEPARRGAFEETRRNAEIAVATTP